MLRPCKIIFRNTAVRFVIKYDRLIAALVFPCSLMPYAATVIKRGKWRERQNYPIDVFLRHRAIPQSEWIVQNRKLASVFQDNLVSHARCGFKIGPYAKVPRFPTESDLHGEFP